MSTEAVTPARWRTPAFIIFCGGLIAILTFGPRSTFGFFLQPMSQEFNWGRDIFGFAIAIQNLLWGLGQPAAFAARGLLQATGGGFLQAAGGWLLQPAATGRVVLETGRGRGRFRSPLSRADGRR